MPLPVRSCEYFQVTYSFCPQSRALGFTQPLTEMSTEKFPWGKVWPARTADSSAIAAVSMSK